MRDAGVRTNNDAELTSRPPPANEYYGVGKEASELAGRGRAGTVADDAELTGTELPSIAVLMSCVGCRLQL